MTIEEQRKAFEVWAYSNKWNICRYPKSDYHMKEGQYCDEFVNGAWHGWLASANREGYKFVPVEPTDEMINTYRDKSIAPISTLSVYGYKAMIGACDDH